MKLAKASIFYRALRDIGTLVAVVAFSGNLSFQTWDFRFVILASLVFAAVVSVSLIWEYIVWRRYDYFFEDDSLRITHGVFRRDEREIPYRRIQNVAINKNIVQRVLGLAKTDFETAGGNGTEASLKYVTDDEAKMIQSRVRKFKNGKENEKEDKERERLFELSGSDLLAYSFLSVNVKSVGLGFAGIGIVASIAGGLVESFSIAPLIIIGFLGLLFTAGIWIFNAASNYIQYYDFKLYQEEDTLEYERGLLNRSEGSIPLEKVQGISVEENFLKRQLNYATLKIETAGLSSEQEVKSNEVAIPLAKKSEVIDFARKLEAFDNLDISGIPSRARKRYAARYTVLVSGLVFSGLLVDLYLISFNYWILVALLPFTLIGAHLKWVNKGYEMQEDYFISVNGFWSRRTSVTPYYRVQNLIQTETVFQRRWNLSTLTLDTAGNLIRSDSRAVDLDVKKASKIREEVFEKFKASLD